ncbi:MAG: radical SAM protein [Methanocorpusculum sp.]|nr:radical SAM protein [Methanocorpusculum sp.]
MENTRLTAYLNKNIQNLLTSAVKHLPLNPRESAFLLSQIKYQADNAAKRRRFEEDGTHIPAFLIASITDECNLHCAGCYARANGICTDRPSLPLADSAHVPMDTGEWEKIFSEAAYLGISFILLAGGEPFMSIGVLERAAEFKSIIFPVFTNGTILTEKETGLLDKNRNLIPIFSIEGSKEETNCRRGAGTWEAVHTAAQTLRGMGILFGASITVTAENAEEVTRPSFAAELKDAGVRIFIYVEYTAAAGCGHTLELTPELRSAFLSRLDSLRTELPSVIIIAFPGDEQALGGCLAGGRGFFHISPYGAAEPCPFSPYSDRNLRRCSLLDAISSPLFAELKTAGLTGGEHDGGCVLAQHDHEVQDILTKTKGR